MTTTMDTWVLFLREEMNKVMKCDSSRPLFLGLGTPSFNLASRRPYRQALGVPILPLQRPGLLPSS